MMAYLDLFVGSGVRVKLRVSRLISLLVRSKADPSTLRLINSQEISTCLRPNLKDQTLVNYVGSKLTDQPATLNPWADACIYFSEHEKTLHL